MPPIHTVIWSPMAIQERTKQGKDNAREGHCKKRRCKERTMQGKDNTRKRNARKGQCKERAMHQIREASGR